VGIQRAELSPQGVGSVSVTGGREANFVVCVIIRELQLK